MMPQINVEQLTKTYRIAKRDPGFVGTLRGLIRLVQTHALG